MKKMLVLLILLVLIVPFGTLQACDSDVQPANVAGNGREVESRLFWSSGDYQMFTASAISFPSISQPSSTVSSVRSSSSKKPVSSAPDTQNSATPIPSGIVSSGSPGQSSQGHAYSETLVIYNTAGQIQQLNTADLIVGIVAMEMGSSYHPEALKAQTITSYTYITYYNKQNRAPTCAYYTIDQCKSRYGEAGYQSLSAAVLSVLGQTVQINGHPILSVYHAMSAGMTTSATSVWGGTKDLYGSSLSYLTPVDSPFDRQSANYQTQNTVSAQQMHDMTVASLGIDLTGDKQNWLRILSKDSGGYVQQISIGGQVFTGRTLRESVFDYGLRSAAFDVAYRAEDDSFVFTVYGYGHGVGMSQQGANGMAKNGFSYVQILEHYFTGAKVVG